MLPVFRIEAGQQSKNGNHHSHPRHSTIYQLQTIVIIIQNSSYMHKTSSSMPQSKDSTECSQNPYCLQPTLLPTSVFLQIPQTLTPLVPTSSPRLPHSGKSHRFRESPRPDEICCLDNSFTI